MAVKDDRPLPRRGRRTKKLDLVGQVYGRLRIVGEAPNIGKRTRWSAVCACGNTCTPATDALRSGVTISCGCYGKSRLGNECIKHGEKSRTHKDSVEYRAWLKMISRCENERDPKFRHYGLRGIYVCAEWRASFSCFLADVGRRPIGKTSIGRRDVNLPYEPTNVRWEDDFEQSRAKRTNVFVEFDGKTVVLADAARLAGVNYKRLHKLFRGEGIPLATAIRRLGGRVS